MTIALVTAAGVGSRMNLSTPKQFLTVYGKPIIVYTLETLQANENIDQVVIACLPGWERELESYVSQYELSKVRWIVPGGETGQKSIMNCLSALNGNAEDDELIIVHDGNRPLLEDFVINESVRVAMQYGSAVAAIPSVEAILRTEKQKDGVLSSVESIDRDTVMRTQTPHCFKYKELVESYNELSKTDSNAVAPCTVMVSLGKRVFFSPGSELNFKITTQNDLAIFKAMIKNDPREPIHD